MASANDRTAFFRWIKSLGLSSHERRAVWFLIIVLILSAGYRVYRHHALLNSSGITITPAGSEFNPADSIYIKTSSPYIINLNAAGCEELELLPGIGPVKAERIYKYRLKNGSFNSADELLSVYGIGPKTLERLKPFITLDSIAGK